MLLALGARLLDATGSPVPDPGARLDVVAELDLDGLHPALRDTDIVLACDVDNPLAGVRGAAAVYGRQKGLTQQDIPIVDAHLKEWADVMSAATGRDRRDTPGAGAAGGVGFAAMAALNAQMRPGIQLVLELVRFHEHLADADLVITGEGSLDEQTLAGKAPAGVAAAAAEAGVEVIAICGRRELDAEQLRAMGISASYALQDIEKDPALCVANAYRLLCTLAEHIGLVHLGSAPT
jgi:glycerate kinase